MVHFSGTSAVKAQKFRTDFPNSVRFWTSSSEFINLIRGDDKTKETLSWDDFRFNLNLIHWQKPNLDELSLKVKNIYVDANKKIQSGQMPQAKEKVF